MSFEGIWGQPTAVGTLERALERRQVHHAYRMCEPAVLGPLIGEHRKAELFDASEALKLG